MAVTEALSLMQAWWAAPIGQAVGLGGSGPDLGQSRFSSLVFATHGITPLGYAAFAFALGVTAGLLIRRTVPAMAVTLAIFAAVQVAMPLWVRPHLVPARATTVATIAAAGANVSLQRPSPGGAASPPRTVPGQPGAWILSSGAVNAAGQPVSTIPAACEPALPHSAGHERDCPAQCRDNCLASHGIRERRHLPARQPLLALPVDRDRDLPRPRPGPGRVLLLAAQPPPAPDRPCDYLAARYETLRPAAFAWNGP